MSGFILAWSNIGNLSLSDLDTFSDGLAEREWLIMLLKATVLSGIKDCLISDTLLGEEAFENMVSSLRVNELATDRVNPR